MARGSVCACAPLRHWRGFSRAFLYTAVWCQFFDEQRQTWTKARLIVATESGLDAPTIVQLYARRWGIEPLFHNLKRRWGLNHLWQHTRIVLELWIQIRSCAWSLTQLLSLAVADTFPIDAIAPVAQRPTRHRRAGCPNTTPRIYRSLRSAPPWSASPVNSSGRRHPMRLIRDRDTLPAAVCTRVRASFHRVARFIAHYRTVSARATAGCLKFST